MIVKRAVKRRIRMEFSIREVDKGSDAKMPNTHEAVPFGKFRDRSESDESGPFGKLKALVFLVGSVKL